VLPGALQAQPASSSHLTQTSTELLPVIKLVQVSEAMFGCHSAELLVTELRYRGTFLLPIPSSIDWWSLSSGESSLWWRAIHGLAQEEE